MMGIWYLSTATANKFAGTLSGLYPEAGKVKTCLLYTSNIQYSPHFTVLTLQRNHDLLVCTHALWIKKMPSGQAGGHFCCFSAGADTAR